MIKLEYIEGKEELLEEIGFLWEKLNELHRIKSKFFSERFDKFKFEDRKVSLIEKGTKGDIKIIVVKDILEKEKDENLIDAGFRELYEETGAEEFELVPVCIYSVSYGEKTTYGQLFYSEVKNIGNLPEFEIEEIKFVEELPERLTYHSIQPYLFKRVQEFLGYIR